MKNTLLIFLFSSFAICSYAQIDTLYINNEVTLARVVEVTEDAVKFIYPKEELINTVYKNRIQRIAFNSGRLQTFTEGSSFKKVSSVEDYENVSIAAIDSEVKGLTKIGDVSAKAKGTTTIANQERVKQRAYMKLKIEAAMMGANIIYLTNQRSQGNQLGGYYQTGSSTETSLTGVAYSNVIPNFSEFQQLMENKNFFITGERYKLKKGGSNYSKARFNKEFSIISITNENDAIVIEANLMGEKNKLFRLAGFDDTGFNVFYTSKNAIYNLRIFF